MGEIHAPAHAKSVSLEAVVIRADGSREVLGEVAYWHRNPVRRWLRPLVRRLKGA